MNLENQKKFLLSIACYGILAAAVYLAIRFLLPPLGPFIVGFLIAWLLRRPSVFLANKLHIPQKIPAALLIAIGYFVLIALVFLVGMQLVSAVMDFVPTLPNLLTNQLLPFINRCLDWVKDFAAQYDLAEASQIDTWFADMISSLSQAITTISSAVVKLVSGIASAMPTFILRIVLTVISTFYFALDYNRIMAFFGRILPAKVKNTVLPVKDKVISSLKIYLRSYSLIFLLTTAELSFGFFLLRLPYPVLLGIIVAIIDILPVLGTGLVLLPWAVISLFTGRIAFGIGMAVLYIAITVIRNIVEPKLVGIQIGLHPLATLISLFVGLQLFGIIGMFILPVLLSVLVQFHRDGIIRKPAWMGESEEEAAKTE